MRTSAMVYFKRWAELDPTLQMAAFAAIKDDLQRHVSEKARELYEGTTVTVELSEANGGALLVDVELDHKEFPNGNLGEIIGNFLADCQDPQIIGFELTTDIGGVYATDVVGGGQDQTYGSQATIPVREAF